MLELIEAFDGSAAGRRHVLDGVVRHTAAVVASGQRGDVSLVARAEARGPRGSARLHPVLRARRRDRARAGAGVWRWPGTLVRSAGPSIRWDTSCIAIWSWWSMAGRSMSNLDRRAGRRGDGARRRPAAVVARWHAAARRV